jgi:hypothetical protein
MVVSRVRQREKSEVDTNVDLTLPNTLRMPSGFLEGRQTAATRT